MSAANDEWYYAQNGQRIGPVSLAAVQTLLSRGALGVEDYVWTEGMANWSPVGTVPELSAATVGVTTATPTVAQPPQQQPAGYPQPAYGGYTSPYPQQGLGTVGYYTPPSMGGLPYAGFWLRFVAFLLDQLILMGVMMGVGFVVGMFVGVASVNSGGRSPGAKSAAALVPLAMNLVSFVATFLYYTLQEAGSAQATFGKRAAGIIVTNDSGNRISYGQAVGRFFGKWISWIILGFGFFMAGWTQRKQALHDMMAGTLVVRRR